MTTISSIPDQSPVHSGSLMRRAWAFNWPLTLTVLINLALVPIVLVAMLVDPKVITGVNGWIKPLKFTVSVVIYAATLLWLLMLVQGRRRWVQAAANVTAFALMVEIVLIILQVVRGTTSHFNIATPFDAAIFSTMGALITLVAVFNLMVGIWLVFQRMPRPRAGVVCAAGRAHLVCGDVGGLSHDGRTDAGATGCCPRRSTADDRGRTQRGRERRRPWPSARRLEHRRR